MRSYRVFKNFPAAIGGRPPLAHIGIGFARPLFALLTELFGIVCTKLLQQILRCTCGDRTAAVPTINKDLDHVASIDCNLLSSGNPCEMTVLWIENRAVFPNLDPSPPYFRSTRIWLTTLERVM